MTDVVIIAMVTSIPPTIAAVAALFVSIRNGWKADLAAVKQQEIHVLVNSNLTAVKNDLEEAKAEIKALRSLVTQLTSKERP